MAGIRVDLPFQRLKCGLISRQHPARKSHSGPENAPPFSVGCHHKAAIAEVGANVRGWVYTGHSQVAKRNSAVFGVSGGFSKT